MVRSAVSLEQYRQSEALASWRENRLRVCVGNAVIDWLKVPYNLLLLVCCENQRRFGCGPFFDKGPHPRDMVPVVNEDHADFVLAAVNRL